MMEKKIREILAEAGKVLLGIEKNKSEVKVVFASNSADLQDEGEYCQLIYFQEDKNCGYYSSYGFGCELREYRKGRMRDLMNEMQRRVFDILPDRFTCIVFEEIIKN